MNQIIVCGTAFLFFFDWTHRLTGDDGAVAQVGLGIGAVQVVGDIAAVDGVERSGPEVAAVTLLVDMVGPPVASVREEYTVSVRAGCIISPDSVICAVLEGAVIQEFLYFFKASLHRHPI